MAQESPTSPSPEDETAMPVASAPAPATNDAPAGPMPAPNALADQLPNPLTQVLAPPFVSRPPHTQTKSNLSPTSEFTRVLMLAFTSRYGLRGGAKLLYPTKVARQQLAYSLGMGVGSGALSLNYNSLVKNDIHNIFCEAVAYEKGVPPESVSLHELTKSDNAIVQRTMSNYKKNSFKRLFTDALFFLATPLFFNKKLTALHEAKEFDFEVITDALIGVKGIGALVDTWNRKTTMFEDLVTFVNNKINPRNGLGQPITVGEIFDLYQHYSDDFHPDRMFKNPLLRDAEEAQAWARSEPVFQRIAELLNHTYAYKHNIAVGDYGKPDADFALPKFIYLLGHDLIRPRQPEQTLLVLNVANQYGMQAVQQMQQMLAAGASLESIAAQFPIQPDKWTHEKPAEGANRVIAKGSTTTLERVEAPATAIDSSTVRSLERAMPLAQPSLA